MIPSEAFTWCDHWLDQAVRVPSPHCNDRPDPADLSLIVVHNISLPPGQFGSDDVDDLFLNRLDPSRHPFFREIQGLQVSAHFLIRRDGGLRQYVPCHRRAWHAGRSSFRGRDNCNDFSIGIELEGTDDVPFTNPQYGQLARLIQALLRAYPTLSADRLVGHSDIAPGRKTDPGPCFDWSRLRRELARMEDRL